jgi:hypothetical protein
LIISNSTQTPYTLQTDEDKLQKQNIEDDKSSGFKTEGNYYATDAVDFFELSEDISDYQISDKEKKEALQTGKDVFDAMINSGRNGEWNLENAAIIFIPQINPRISSHDPVSHANMLEEFNNFDNTKHFSAESVKYMEDQKRIFDLYLEIEQEKKLGTDEKSIQRLENKLDQLKEAIAPMKDKLKKENAIELEKRALEEERTRPKSFREYKNKQEEDWNSGEGGNIFRKTPTVEEYKEELKDRFQDRYHLTDEFRKTEKFEELYQGYVKIKNQRDQKIVDERPDLNFFFQDKHLRNRLGGDTANFEDSLLASGKDKGEWIEHFNHMKSGLETILVEAKAVRDGDLIRDDGMQRGDTRGGLADPDKAIPDIEKSIRYFDTVINTLKDKWKYGSLNVSS